MVEDRKARLAALTAAAQKTGRGGSGVHNDDNDTTHKKGESKIKFRNYVPNDESLDKAQQPPSSKRKRLSEQENHSPMAHEETKKEDRTEQKEKSELELALEQAKADASVLNQASQSTSSFVEQQQAPNDGGVMSSSSSIKPLDQNTFVRLRRKDLHW